MEIKVNNRYEELDGLRGLAAMTVFFSHAIGMLSFKIVGYYSFLHFAWDGAAAVILFFVLSGTCLSIPYLGNEKNVEIKPFQFIIKRIFRIYPAYIAALILAILLKNYFFNMEGFVESSTWIQSFWRNEISISQILNHVALIGPHFDSNLIDPVIWSLIVEMKVSIIIPVFLVILQRLNRKASIMLLILTFIVGLLMSNRVLFHFMPAFLLGAILAKYRFELIRILKILPLVIKIIISVLMLILYSIRFSLGFDLTLVIDEYFINNIIALGSALLICFAISSDKYCIVLRNSVVQFLGRISYSFYLVHLPILLTISSQILFLTKSIFLSITTSFIISIIVSSIFQVVFESPFRKVARLGLKKLECYQENKVNL